jgi:UDP-glucose 4-epimerase
MNNKPSVLVTGCNGFIGRRHLVPYLAARGHQVIAASRTMPALEGRNVTCMRLPDLSEPFDWQPVLQKCDAVIHLAGIAHTPAGEETYDRVNRQATEKLARATEQSGIDLIFVSSIAAQSGSSSERELSEDDTPRPVNAYGRSKLAAEQAVRSSGTLFTILRPVVMYREGEKGNFAFIHKISGLPIPLPLGRLKAKRSVLSIGNFCSAIEFVLTNSRARGETFIVSDPEPVAVPELIARHRATLGRSPGLLSIPEKWIEGFFSVTGQNAIWQRIGCPLIAAEKAARIRLENDMTATGKPASVKKLETPRGHKRPYQTEDCRELSGHLYQPDKAGRRLRPEYLIRSAIGVRFNVYPARFPGPVPLHRA